MAAANRPPICSAHRCGRPATRTYLAAAAVAWIALDARRVAVLQRDECDGQAGRGDAPESADRPRARCDHVAAVAGDAAPPRHLAARQAARSADPARSL